MPIKIYTPEDHYLNSNRGDLIDLLKPFWGKAAHYSEEDRKKEYGLSSEDVQFVDEINPSDIVILPMSWNYYYKTRQLNKAKELVETAAAAGKKVLSWTNGDFGVRVPHFNNLTVLRQSGYRSRLPDYHKGMPVFFVDPLAKYYNLDNIVIREKQEKPVIGFCGQAKARLEKYILEIIRTSLRNLKYYAGLSEQEPQDIYPSTLRRSKVLKTIEQDERLLANFIKREQYRAGANTPEERHRTTLEFYDNMVHSDYVVCVRGGGNFSVRLYETLAMGRIPVFVNTDCLLPLADEIDWRRHVVWVEEKEIAHIGNYILDFHSSISDEQFKYLQSENRKLWVEKLNLGVFYNLTLNAIPFPAIH